MTETLAQWLVDTTRGVGIVGMDKSLQRNIRLKTEIQQPSVSQSPCVQDENCLAMAVVVPMGHSTVVVPARANSGVDGRTLFS